MVQAGAIMLSGLQPGKSEDIASHPGCVCGPGFVFPSDADQFHNIQQVVQGIGAVPELMLPPEAGGHRQKEELIQVRGAYAGETAGREADPLPAKKPESVQSTDSIVSFRQLPVSYSSSGKPHSFLIITG